MSDYPGLVDAALRPELAALASVDPDAASRRVRAMTRSSLAFFRGAQPLCAAWLVRKAGLDGTWAWSMGDAHHGNFATLAVGRPDPDGIVPVTYDLIDVDDEHPAPWRWDFIRLFASVALAMPRQKGSEFTALVATALEGYARALEDNGDAIIDLADLPEALKDLIGEDSGAPPARAFLASRIVGEGDDARLRLDAEVTKDLSARAYFLPALASALGDDGRLTITDVARRATSGVASLGRRRWYASARERHGARAQRLRLIEIKERPPSALAHLLQVTPFAPAPGPAGRLTVSMGGDPYQRILHAPAGTYLVRSRCHCRKTLDPAKLDPGDLSRLVRLWGCLLANFHLRGLRALRADVPTRANDIATEASAARKDIARLAWEHAAFAEKSYGAFRRLAKEWQA
jgi:hypothetical protein